MKWIENVSISISTTSKKLDFCPPRETFLTKECLHVHQVQQPEDRKPVTRALYIFFNVTKACGT